MLAFCMDEQKILALARGITLGRQLGASEMTVVILLAFLGPR